jgi:hypothetical protein
MLKLPRGLEPDAAYRIRLAEKAAAAEDAEPLPQPHCIPAKAVEDMNFEELCQYAPSVGERIYGNETMEGFRERLRQSRNRMHRQLFGLEYPQKPLFMSEAKSLVSDALNYEPEEKTVVMDNGSKRSHLEGRRDLIPKAAIDAMGRRLELGAAKYGEQNWRRGGEQTRQSCINHIINHILDYVENGNTSDENTAAIITNAAFLCHFETLKPLKGASEQNGKI